MNASELPVVVIGAGPSGLAAAAHLIDRGLVPLVLEAGPSAGTSVRGWHHVRLFSRWGELIDGRAEKLLAPTGWQTPDADRYPTGAEWAQRYLQPLADVLGDRVRFGTRVIGVARKGRDLVVDEGRDREPLTVHVTTETGEELITARAVVDASGTWSEPNPLGGDGLLALGERSAADRIVYRIPDLNDPAVRARYAGKRIAVAGSGHSALTALVAFAELADTVPGTHVDWLLRRSQVGDTFGGGQADQLPARGALGEQARRAVAAGHISTVNGFRTAAVIRRADGQVVLEGLDGQRLAPVNEVVVLTGFRPDLSFLSEVRLNLDSVLQAPRELAPMIDPNVHSCGTVYPHGARELAQPEPGVFCGHEELRARPDVPRAHGLRADSLRSGRDRRGLAGRRRVELLLPETGVCSGGGLVEESVTVPVGGGCCGPTEPATDGTASTGPGDG